MSRNFKEFKQFVTDKDKGKAPVKKIADYVGPIPNSPPGGGATYAATGKGGKASKGAKVGSDWTDKGDKKLVYKPSIDQDKGDKKGAAKCVDSVKEFVDRTKGLSAAEFAQYLATNSKNAGVVHESIHSTCKVLSESPSNVADLVRALRRSGLLTQTVQECLWYPESYDAIAEMLGDGEKGTSVRRRLEEMVGPPMHHGMHPHGMPPHHGMLNMGDGGMLGDPTGGGAKLSPVGDPSMGGGHPGDDMGMDDLGGEEHDLGDDDIDTDDDDLGLDDEDMDGMGDPTQGAAAPMGAPIKPPHHPHGAGVGLPRHHPDSPKPSMMARLMGKA